MTLNAVAPVRTVVYVINLERSIERRAHFERQVTAARSSVPWTYHRAHTELSSELQYDPRDAIVAKGRALYPAELGVYSSHYSAWQRFLAEGVDQVLILEDDVVVDWDFVATLASCDLGALGLNYLKLFNKNITPFRVVSEHFHRRTLIDCRGFAHGMQAYMVTRAGAERFLGWCRRVRRPIDDELDRSWAHGVPNIAIFPFPAFERHGPSTIGLKRYEQHAVPLTAKGWRTGMRIVEKLRRSRQRIAGYGYQLKPLNSLPAYADDHR